MIRVLYFSGYFTNRETLKEKLGLREGAEREILSLGFGKWGKAFLPELNGLFSFALADEDSGIRYCGRDRFGGKGLYYALFADGTPCFAGTIRELLAEAKIPAVFREEMLEVYLSYSYVPGQETMIRGIEKPLPGYLYSFSSGIVRKERWFTPRYRIEERPEEEWEEQLSAIFGQIFDSAEKGGASLLSSGVDSSYLCRSLSVRDTYSAAYREERFSESAAAGEFSARIGARHHAVSITPEAYLASVPEVMRALEQPTGDASAEVLFELCRTIRKDTDRCCSGEGIDELFMGYYLKLMDLVPARQTLREGGYIGCTRMFSEEEKKRFLKHYGPTRRMVYTEEAYALSEHEERLDQAALVDLLVWLNGDLLPNLYGIGTATGLDVITPYFDNRLYDITMRIPASLKHDSSQTKKIFRKTAARVLGSDLAQRPKRGFPAPTRCWIRRPDYVQKIRAAFRSDTAAMFFRTEELFAYYDAMLADPADEESWHGIWCIYCFLVWYEQMRIESVREADDGRTVGREDA